MFTKKRFIVTGLSISIFLISNITSAIADSNPTADTQVAKQRKRIVVKVPVKSEYEQRHQYPIDLINFVLGKADVDYSIKFNTASVTTQSRDRQRLKVNQGINLGWFGTSEELEKDLVPIRFPIWRGLLGYRIFIIHKANQAKFDLVSNLEELKKYRGNQGIGWSDIKILESAGLQQEEIQYDLIFAKIDKKRDDYFSRGVSEAFTEVEARMNDYPNLSVERNILLVYPFAGFFFTNKENKDLAEAMEAGFKNSYEDGSFLKFFYSHTAVKKVFEQARLEDRIRIDIPNPLMTKETLTINKLYWHQR